MVNNLLDPMPMIDTSTLVIFAAAVIVLLMSPGPSMAFVISHGARYGWAGGIAAAAGIAAADGLLTVLTVGGVTAWIVHWSHALQALRAAGAAYLLWMAWKAWMSPNVFTATCGVETSLMPVFIRSTLNSLLNPKALLFYLVFLPQFVHVGTVPIAQQLLILGSVLTILAFVFHAALGMLGGALQQWLIGHPQRLRLQSKGLAMVLILLAARIAFS